MTPQADPQARSLPSEPSAFRDNVRAYYDGWNGVIVDNFGGTYQTALFRGPDGQATARGSNREIARRAGLKPGDRVLDAGCGTCGPAIDIAQALPGITVEGVTISQAQAATAQRFIAAAGLDDRIRVQVADFHTLPFDDGTFDAALFLETSGYSLDQAALFAEAHRVLAGNGRLYVKTVATRSLDLDTEASAQLDAFNRVYAWKTRTIEAEIASAREAGFTVLACRDLSSEIDVRQFGARMYRAGDAGELSEFGRRHHTPLACVPIAFAEFVAVKRSYAARLFG